MEHVSIFMLHVHVTMNIIYGLAHFSLTCTLRCRKRGVSPYLGYNMLMPVYYTHTTFSSDG